MGSGPPHLPSAADADAPVVHAAVDEGALQGRGGVPPPQSATQLTLDSFENSSGRLQAPLPLHLPPWMPPLLLPVLRLPVQRLQPAAMLRAVQLVLQPAMTLVLHPVLLPALELAPHSVLLPVVPLVPDSVLLAVLFLVSHPVVLAALQVWSPSEVRPLVTGRHAAVALLAAQTSPVLLPPAAHVLSAVAGPLLLAPAAAGGRAEALTHAVVGCWVSAARQLGSPPWLALLQRGWREQPLRRSAEVARAAASLPKHYGASLLWLLLRLPLMLLPSLPWPLFSVP